MALLLATARRLQLELRGAARAACLHASALATVQEASNDGLRQVSQPPVPPPPLPPAASAASARRAPAVSSSTAIAVRQPEGLVQRSLAAALNAINRLVMLVGSIHRLSANETYVRRYLEAEAGLDSFALEYLHVTRPAIFRLSVGKQIEPVVSWLRSLGIGPEAAELVRHSPEVLSASIDEQLEPLADFIRQAGGCPREVLLAYPGLAAVPVAHVKGTRHVLRQLGVADEDISLLLVSLPDLYAQLALTLHQLFSDFGVAAWKLHARQRRQLGGVIQHHMRHWQRGRTAPHRAEAAASSDSEDEAAAGGGGGGGRVAHAGRTHLRGAPAGGHQRRGHLLHTSYLLDREVFLGLKRVQAALEALPLQDDPEDWEAAVSGLAHAIDQLGELAAARAAREVA